MGRKKPGPKPKPAGEVRSQSIRVMVTAEEKEQIESAADLLGLSGGASELIRNRVVKYSADVIKKRGE